ncbi:hydrolase or metal-binding protein [Alcanivorax sp. VBW004]|uniref:recombination directionality factor n=1 Tax=Alcanivorax sp. VBW004 TaxID=1287708 RepID=UPI0012BB6D3B|nr:hydrolase or metal-binding protein [Alcanivorax sp. VBW004]MTT54188.1 hydrolase or metal-binding protein [Alcanivorax sp. VBW004]
MIKGLAITPPVIGRISIGRMVEKNGKRLPEKDDQFTITTQIQTREGWLPHPLDEALRQEVQGKKLRSIPVTLPFNDPDLNLRAEYTFFERKSGRALCAGDGEACRRHTENGLESLPCPSPDMCDYGSHGLCKPYGRLYVCIGDDDELGCFVFRTTGYNSIRTLTARLRYFHAISGGNLATLPLELKLRGKSTTQSHRAPIYYVDLTLRAEQSMEDAVSYARETAKARGNQGINQAELDKIAHAGLLNAQFEYSEEEGLQVVEEFVPEDAPSPGSTQPQSAQGLSQKLADKKAFSV